MPRGFGGLKGSVPEGLGAGSLCITTTITSALVSSRILVSGLRCRVCYFIAGVLYSCFRCY